MISGNETFTSHMNYKQCFFFKHLIKKIFAEFLKTNRNIDDKLTQIHINESFPEKSESNVRCSTIYNESQFEKFNEPSNNQQPTSNFLDEQYKLTKQAIAIRYMPQMKINFISTKNSLLKGWYYY